ncbi:MAG: efflux RND transporter permease subunit, partial [Kiritimatiellae bacterium]|nr:efflux RND transporter permease subunit [Kiritimatiellia bacterium]
PAFDIDVVNVTVAYPGSSPEEVEKGIVQAIEEAVRAVDGVEKVVSRAREGVGVVSCELLLGADRQQVYQDVRQEIDRIRTFPDDAEEPQVSLPMHRRGVITLVVFGDEEERLLYDLAEQIRQEILQDKNVTQVSLSGVRDQEITVSISQDTLRAYGLTVLGVANVIRNASIELPAGGLKTKGGEILLRLKDRRDWGEEFARIPVVRTLEGRQVLLGEIAEVKDEFEDTDRLATYNGKRAVLIDIDRVGEQTPLKVAAAVLRVTEELNTKLPPTVQIAVLRDRSVVYKQRALMLTKNGLIGLILVVILLGSFLQARLAFWVAMGIPISFLGGMLFLPAWDVTINMISMFAFLISLGIVVDDAIVVGENIYEYRQRGFSFLDAAVRGTREVYLPVVFSVLTNIVAFFPLFMVPGVIGKIWKVIPSVVVTVFAISLIECLFVLPAHLGHDKERKRNKFGEKLHARQQRFSVWFMFKVRTVYGPFLDRVLVHRYLTVVIAIALLILTVAYVKSGRIGVVPMPRVDANYSVVTAVLPYGSSVENTKVVRARLIKTAQKLGAEITQEDKKHRVEVTGVYAEIGESFRGVSGGHVVGVRAYLADADNRPVNTKEFTRRWRAMLGSRMVGVEAMRFESDRGGPGSGVALSVQLSHMDSEQLEKACRDTSEYLEGFTEISDVDVGFSVGKEQMDFRILPAGLNMNLTSGEIARQMRYAFYGAEALRQQRGRNEVKVRVRLPESERGSEQDIEDLLIRTPAGTFVPLFEVAEPVRGRSYTSIVREDGRRVLTVTADVNPVGASQRMLTTFLEDKFPELRDKYPGLGYGFAGRQHDFRQGFSALGVGFIVAVMMIYVLLAVPFRSYTQPLIIMASIPFGIVGAVIGHVIMGYNLNMMSMMGIIALSGVVVNDSLVLIDFANRKKAEGMSIRDAMLNAGVRRFRPIMLTTLTTFCGLAPMIFEQSRQARFMIPMALSLGYGIIFATAITLAIVPALYMISDDIKPAIRRGTNFVLRKTSLHFPR